MENESKYSKIKLDNITLPRYVKVKESIEALMRVIDIEQAEKDGYDRVLAAILQLIDENDDKTIDEKYDDITDSIYNGNIFGHYFKGENKDKAIDILSKTTLLNDDERFVYICNFYMPGDVAFKDVYTECGKNIDNIVKKYKLSADADASKLVMGRILEISKFYVKYQEELERQQRMAETEILAAVQDAIDDPTNENIARAESMVSGMVNGSLRESLESQLQTVKDSSIEETPIEPVEEVKPAEPLAASEVLEEEPVQMEIPMEEIAPVEMPVEETVVEEPKTLEISSSEPETSKEDSVPEVGKEVMLSLQKLVATSRENAKRVQDLETELESRDKQIADLGTTIDAKEEEIVRKDSIISDRDSEISTKNERISALEADIKDKDQALINASQIITAREEEIATLNSRVESLTATLESYKTSLTDIQQFLASAQPVQEPVAEKKIA